VATPGRFAEDDLQAILAHLDRGEDRSVDAMKGRASW
jgi:hypothetical protein